MIPIHRTDRGQAFPIYIMMVAGLLFVAFAFFAVGQASATRNDAQGAADAAALAAAQDARDNLGVPLFAALESPQSFDQFLRDYRYGYDSCPHATRLAASNRSDLQGCSWEYGYLRDRVTAKVRTQHSVGSSVIPGTERKHATADATAVIEFRCTWKAKELIYTFDCDTRSGIVIDPLHPQSWATLSKALFAVHLVD
ncbi:MULTISPECIES: pilus assembly protein TadG-related protein [unclassified Streptomyces]|uniref:pilus assembly protein TadG-related protein n=1 Tax=unclassified Streptomyces TaxID=2593676 RepID=UPI0035E11449